MRYTGFIFHVIKVSQPHSVHDPKFWLLEILGDIHKKYCFESILGTSKWNLYNGVVSPGFLVTGDGIYNEGVFLTEK